MNAVKRLVLDFAEYAGVDEPAFDDDVISIRFDEMVLNFSPDEDRAEICLSTDVRAVPDGAEARQRLFARLLKLNCLGRETRGGILGIDPGESRVIYSRTFPAGRMTVAQLEMAVEAMLDMREAFRRHMQ